jgi:hypothetical protein
MFAILLFAPRKRRLKVNPTKVSNVTVKLFTYLSKYIIVVFKIIDPLSATPIFFFSPPNFDIIFIMRDNHEEPRVRKPANPFEGVQFTTRNKSVKKKAAAKPKIRAVVQKKPAESRNPSKKRTTVIVESSNKKKQGVNPVEIHLTY